MDSSLIIKCINHDLGLKAELFASSQTGVCLCVVHSLDQGFKTGLDMLQLPTSLFSWLFFADIWAIMYFFAFLFLAEELFSAFFVRHSFCLSEKLFISHSYLKDYFAG